MKPIVAAAVACIAVSQIQAEEIRLASHNGVEIWSIDGPELPELEGEFQTRILRFRTEDPSNTIVTFWKMRIDGGLRQVWLDLGNWGPQITPTQYDFNTSLTLALGLDFEAMKEQDSHYLIPKGAGSLRPACSGPCGLTLTESNDYSIQPPMDIDPSFPDDFDYSQLVAIGLGSIFHTVPDDAWYLNPDLQSNQVDFAQLVIACNDPVGVHFSGNILGDGFDEAAFENVAVSCISVPEPKTLGLVLLAVALLICARRRGGWGRAK